MQLKSNNETGTLSVRAAKSWLAGRPSKTGGRQLRIWTAAKEIGGREKAIIWSLQHYHPAAYTRFDVCDRL